VAGRTEHTIGVAIAIPEPHGRELQSWREQFGDPAARKIPAHVTLLPPTVVAEDELPTIEEHLLRAAAASEPSACTCAAPVPSGRLPRWYS